GGKEDSLRYQQMRARTQLLFEETPGMAGKRFRAMLNDNPRPRACARPGKPDPGEGVPLRRASKRGAVVRPTPCFDEHRRVFF
ncbi:hypothetical protein GH868_30595, partial [Bacillus thuringiensis]|nr:hypothetical protein [Bacillus thuringiensis]